MIQSNRSNEIRRHDAFLNGDAHLIVYWQKEIAGLEKSLARAMKRLRRGQ